MKIVSTTLAGNNESIIADALRSIVEWVDACIVVDTGITDSTLEVARQIAGDKLHVVSYTWKNDFSDARNFAIQAATDLGGDWAFTVDTDERILGGEHIRSFLESTDVVLGLAEYVDGHYRKERAFRLPENGAYVGPTHEAYTNYKGPSASIPNVKFTELGKSHEAAKAKFKRDIAILTDHTQKNPRDPRWWFYLGESHKNFGDPASAIEAYRKCWELDGWDEESAWSCYRMAECYMNLGQKVKAIETCMLGVARHPGFGELFWFAGYISYTLGRYDKAVLFSKLALKMGWTEEGIGRTINRTGFKHVPGLVEGPYDVLHYSCRMLGRVDEAEEYANKCSSLYESRTGITRKTNGV